jgi:hypothetical protein
MSVTSLIRPVEFSDSYVVEITVSPGQLRQEAKDFITSMIRAGISPTGLQVDDFMPVMLRRRMASLTKEAKRLAFTCCCPAWMVFDEEDGEGRDPCIRFVLPTVTEAVAFKIALL